MKMQHMVLKLNMGVRYSSKFTPYTSIWIELSSRINHENAVAKAGRYQFFVKLGCLICQELKSRDILNMAVACPWEFFDKA